MKYAALHSSINELINQKQKLIMTMNPSVVCTFLWTDELHMICFLVTAGPSAANELTLASGNLCIVNDLTPASTPIQIKLKLSVG